MAKTLKKPKPGITHWTTRDMAREVGISHSSVQRIWNAHALQPHRVQTFKFTTARRVSLTADWYADDYWLVDAYVRFSGEALSELLRSTEFSIVANNLLDKAYLSAITENATWLGAPRTISMTATISF